MCINYPNFRKNIGTISQSLWRCPLCSKLKAISGAGVCMMCVYVRSEVFSVQLHKILDKDQVQTKQ